VPRPEDSQKPKIGYDTIPIGFAEEQGGLLRNHGPSGARFVRQNQQKNKSKTRQNVELSLRALKLP